MLGIEERAEGVLCSPPAELTLMKPRPAILFCVVLILWFATAAVHAAQPIRIGVSIALSGKYAPMGTMYADGLRLWEKDINAKGDLLGRTVKLLIRDDRSSLKGPARSTGRC